METAAWVTPEDAAFPLDGTDGIKILLAPGGRFAPPVLLDEDRIAFHPGSLVRSAVHGARDVIWPALIQKTSETALRTTLREWAVRMDPARGNGRLRVTGPDATVRELACIVVAGLELDETNGYSQLGWHKTVLHFHAPWPYWLSTVDELETWDATAPPQWFPFSYPFRVGSGDVLGTRTITVLGDVEAQPVWVVHGPGAGLSLRNITTGRTLAWDGVLGPNETLTIDTRGPALSTTPRRVYRNSGADEFGSLSKYDMWPLLAGGQEIEVTMTGADDTSSVECHYRPNYLTD